MASAYSVRPSIHSLEVREGNHKCQPIRGGVCYSRGEIFNFKHLTHFGGKSHGRPGFKRKKKLSLSFHQILMSTLT